MSEILKMTIPGNPEYIRITKSAVGSAAALEGFDFDCVEDIQIAVAEACKNITCHGFDGWCKSYDLTCDMREDSIKITITDETMQHIEQKGKRPCEDCPKEGDLGICIIESIMDEVQIIKAGQGNKSIVMVKNK